MAAFVLLIERPDAGAVTPDDIRGALGLDVQVGVYVERVHTREVFDDVMASQPWQVIVAAADLPGLPAARVWELTRRAGILAPMVVLADAAGLDVAIDLVERGASDVVTRDQRWRLRVALTRALREAGPPPRPADEPWLHAVLDQIPHGLLVVDQDACVVWMNSAAGRLLAHAGPGGVQKGGRLPEAWRRPAGAPPSEMLADRADGTTYPVEVQTRPARVADGDLVVYILRDLSERRDLERQLQQAQRLEAVAHLSTGVAHEFNNILTGVLTYASLMRRELGPGHPCIEDIREIEVAGERAAILVRQLLSLSRRQPATPRQVDLNGIVHDATTFLTRVIGPQVDLVVTPGVDLPLVEADPALVEQVLTNLIVNARDALPTGGTVRVVTRPVSFAAPRVGLLPVPAGEYVELEVNDNGVGMDALTLQRCLDPFFTTRPPGQGSGLGLPVVHGIMRQHHGYLDLNSEPGRGSRVRVGFPVRVPEREVPPVDAPTLPPRGGETVLIAEDDDTVRAVMVRVLEPQGYTVVQVRDGDEANLVFRAAPERFDAAVVDLLMPHRSGADLSKDLLALRPDLRILWVSGFGGGAHVTLTPRSDFLAKPFNSTEFLRRLRALLDRP